MSETDAPLTYYELSPKKSQEWPPSTGGQFLQLIGEGPETHVEKLAPEKFFRDLRPSNEDREDQVAALQNVMTGELQNLECFRVGEIQINIFVLGTDGSGKVVGLQTLSVET
jgi:nuclease A inhibitor-like protein